MNLWSPGGVAESPQGDDLYASPAGRSFCAYASSRALLHVGSLSLWDRQPSNAPPLLLSPAGLASRRGPIPKRTWGCAPRPRRVGAPPPGKPKRRLPGELGPPAGRKARWGKEDAPKRGGLPEAQQRVSTTQAEVASDATTLIRCRRRILCRDSVTSKVFA